MSRRKGRKQRPDPLQLVESGMPWVESKIESDGNKLARANVAEITVTYPIDFLPS